MADHDPTMDPDGAGANAACDEVFAVSPLVGVGPEDLELETGAWLGEACLLEEDSLHDATVVAVVETELAVLAAREFHRIVQKFPRLMMRHKHLQSAVRDKKVNMAQLAHKGTHGPHLDRSQSALARFLPSRMLGSMSAPKNLNPLLEKDPN